MAKQNFLGLVKYAGTWANYESYRVDGKLVFADINSGDASLGKYIWANGLEYKVADSADLDELIKRVADVSQYAIDSSIRLNDLSTFLRENVNVSVNDLSTRMHRAETSIGEVSTRINDLSTYVHTTVDASIDTLQAKDVEIDASIDALQAKDQEIDASINDISTRLSTALASAAIDSAAVADSSTVVTLITTNKAGTAATSSFKVAGDGYVTLSGAANNVNIAVTTASVADATVSGQGLADAKDVKDYVDDVVRDLEQALKFIGDITSETAVQELTTEAREAGDTFVASGSNAFDYEGKHIEAGDLVIVKEDSVAGVASNIIIVERNLNGAVTAGAPLATNSLVIGSNGTQAVETTSITVDALNTAIANANSAVQTVSATAGSNYLATSVSVNASTSTVDVSLANDVISASTALDAVTTTGSFADAKAIKDLVDAKAEAIKVQATLNSSTPNYVDASAVVDAAGRIISASVGVITATLADASNGGADFKALAQARDVYNELTKVEETVATAITAMSDTIGLNPDMSVTWSTASGIIADSSIVSAIEQVAAKASQPNVTSFGGKTGAISIDGTGTADGSVAFAMGGSDTSMLTGTVVGWSDLVGRVADVSTHANNNDASIADLSTNVIPAINSSIDRLDSSVSALETKLDTYKVKTIEGEAAIATRPNDDYVAVAAAAPDANGKVVLDASVQLAEAVNLNGITGATAAAPTGLATDATVKDYVAYALAWEVIG